jgi:hypothetical protein
MTFAVDSTGFSDALAGGRAAAPAMTMMMIIKITPSQERGERA